MKAVPRRLLILGGGPVGVEMAQAVQRLGGEAVLIEGAEHLLPREAAPLGEALAEALRRDGIEIELGVLASAARREGDDYVLDLDDGRDLRGDRILVATGRRPRVDGLGLETIGVEASPRGIPVDASLRVADGIWAIGDVNGIWPLTHVGKYQGDVVASNILGEPRRPTTTRFPRTVFTDPQAASVGDDGGRLRGDRRAGAAPEDRDVHARLRGQQRLPHPGQRRRAAHRRLRPRPGGGGVAPTGDPGDSGPRAARSAHGHDPAVPDVLGDLHRGAQGSAGERA